jgi:hypothetical protein
VQLRLPPEHHCRPVSDTVADVPERLRQRVLVVDRDDFARATWADVTRDNLSPDFDTRRGFGRVVRADFAVSGRLEAF